MTRLLIALSLISLQVYADLSSPPRHRYPDWTQQEKERIKKAMAKHGHFTLIRTPQGMYIKRNAEVVWLERR